MEVSPKKVPPEMYVVAAMLKIEGLILHGRMIVRLKLLPLKVKWYFLTIRPDTSIYFP